MNTTIYFVRHAEPDHFWKDNKTRPLTNQGLADTEKVTEKLKDVQLDYAISSNYVRSMETIRGCAADHGLTLHTDERFRERRNGTKGNNRENLFKRWNDFNYHEADGESLAMVQKRNIEGLNALLHEHEGETIIFGTHGTALSTIINHYDDSYDVESFLDMVDYMPYILKVVFEGEKYLGREEIMFIEKVFPGKERFKR